MEYLTSTIKNDIRQTTAGEALVQGAEGEKAKRISLFGNSQAKGLP